MAEIVTQHFGSLAYDENAVLDFPAGLPGFENQTRFALLQPASSAPVVFLQSLSVPSLCFLAAPVDSIDAGYELSVTSEDLRLLGLNEERPPRLGVEILCLVILTAPENGSLTANLLAPVVIEIRTGRAIQAVRVDSRYSHQHPLGPRETVCS
jgi:flagellar assembly factor FliW